MQSYGCKSPSAKPWETSVHIMVVSAGGRHNSGFSLLSLPRLGRFKPALLYPHMLTGTLPRSSADTTRSRKHAPETILRIISWLRPDREKMAINDGGAGSAL